ncbi:MAG: hypothetical protein KatS3mg032_1185 [Cyclobacteriaceae bacterium]|nr:MAG: hypothetical protein KatS3mg032_1185 [Cyclobacteriaceae bacterium]
MKKTGFILAAFVLATTVAAMAQSQTPRADTRQKAQRARIAEGRASGELTPGEGSIVKQTTTPYTKGRTQGQGPMARLPLPKKCAWSASKTVLAATSGGLSTIK